MLSMLISCFLSTAFNKGQHLLMIHWIYRDCVFNICRHKYTKTFNETTGIVHKMRSSQLQPQHVFTGVMPSRYTLLSHLDWHQFDNRAGSLSHTQEQGGPPWSALFLQATCTGDLPGWGSLQRQISEEISGATAQHQAKEDWQLLGSREQALWKGPDVAPAWLVLFGLSFAHASADHQTSSTWPGPFVAPVPIAMGLGSLDPIRNKRRRAPSEFSASIMDNLWPRQRMTAGGSQFQISFFKMFANRTIRFGAYGHQSPVLPLPQGNLSSIFAWIKYILLSITNLR